MNPRDDLHAREVDASRRIAGAVVTSAWVIQELADGLAAAQTRPGFLRLLDAIRADANVTIVEPDASRWTRALDLYRARPDKDWSLTDCTSFTIMQDLHITVSLTADRHFQQAGFRALLRQA